MMRDQLSDDRIHPSDSRAIMIIDRDRNEVIAWALAHTRRADRVLYFYVRKDHRRKGYGRRLYEHAKRIEGDVLVCPSNEVNRAFFRTVGAKAAPGWYF